MVAVRAQGDTAKAYERPVSSSLHFSLSHTLALRCCLFIPFFFVPHPPSFLQHDRGMSPPPSVAAQLETVFKRHGTVRQKRRATFLLARSLDGYGPPPDSESDSDEEDDVEGAGGERENGDDGEMDADENGRDDKDNGPYATGLGEAIRGMVKTSTTRGVTEWDAQRPVPDSAPAVDAEGDDLRAKDSNVGNSPGGGVSPPSAAESYQLLRRRMEGSSARPSGSVGVRGVEQACDDSAGASYHMAGAIPEDGGCTEEREDAEEAPALSSPESQEGGSHREVLQRVVVLAEKGRAHAALAALQAVDGRKRGARVAVPYKVYALLFRALSNGYSARGEEELELAAAPMEALQWLLRGMARQGHAANTTILNFGLETFAVAAKTRKVRGTESSVGKLVCL